MPKRKAGEEKIKAFEKRIKQSEAEMTAFLKKLKPLESFTLDQAIQATGSREDAERLLKHATWGPSDSGYGQAMIYRTEVQKIDDQNFRIAPAHVTASQSTPPVQPAGEVCDPGKVQ